MSDFKSIRNDYHQGTILELSKVPDDPFLFFDNWMNDALKSAVLEPTAMVLSTVALSGRPSSRVVLLKEVSDDGFRFFTNYDSQKGQELRQNPYASIVFFWPELERQIRISGKVEKTDRQVTLDYFNSRPLESRLNAIVSPQSQSIETREELVIRQQKLSQQIETDGKGPECPENWGGYELKPTEFEFWQGGPARLHSRIKYTQVAHSWHKGLLAP